MSLAPMIDFKCLLHLACTQRNISGLDFSPKSLNFNCAFNISTCLSDEIFKMWYTEKKHWFSSQICYILVLSILINAKSIFIFHLNQNCWDTFKYCFLHPIPSTCFFKNWALSASSPRIPFSQISACLVLMFHLWPYPSRKWQVCHCPFFFSKFLPACSLLHQNYLSLLHCLSPLESKCHRSRGILPYHYIHDATIFGIC